MESWAYGMNENITREVVDVGHATGARPTTETDCGVKPPITHLHFETRKSTNINSSTTNPLYGQRYWAFDDENWHDYFVDLGKKYGYSEANQYFMENWENPLKVKK